MSITEVLNTFGPYAMLAATFHAGFISKRIKDAVSKLDAIGTQQVALDRRVTRLEIACPGMRDGFRNVPAANDNGAGVTQ